MYSRPPTVPPSIKERLTKALVFDDADALATKLQAKVALLQRNCVITGSNLTVTQHRDQPRYSKVCGGGYLPQLRQFAIGNYVYVRLEEPASTLQMCNRPTILRVWHLDSGIVEQTGRCGTTCKFHSHQLAPCHLPDVDGTVDACLARPAAELACEVCLRLDREDVMLLCHGCGEGWRIDCMTPALPEVLEGTWVLPHCVALEITVDDIEALPLSTRPAPDQLLQRAPARRRRGHVQAMDGAVIQLRDSKGVMEDCTAR